MSLRFQFGVVVVLLIATSACALAAWAAGDGPIRTVLMFGVFLFGISVLSTGFMTLAQAICPLRPPTAPIGKDPVAKNPRPETKPRRAA